MATFGPFLRKLVTAYVKDRLAKDDSFRSLKSLMNNIKIESRWKIGAYLREMAVIADQCSCQHPEVITPTNDLNGFYEVCKVCGFERHAWYENDGEEGLMGEGKKKVWSKWHPKH